MQTILVAEDRDRSRELLRILLEHSGYSVVEAANGAEAVLLTRQKHPDLVLLDLQMPVKNGFEVLEELRSDPGFNAIPIIAVTACMLQQEKERIWRNGCTGYLTKPLSLARLREELWRLLPPELSPVVNTGAPFEATTP
jgi:two-component system cell cycle response regulator DivK